MCCESRLPAAVIEAATAADEAGCPVRPTPTQLPPSHCSEMPEAAAAAEVMAAARSDTELAGDDDSRSEFL